MSTEAVETAMRQVLAAQADALTVPAVDVESIKQRSANGFGGGPARFALAAAAVLAIVATGVALNARGDENSVSTDGTTSTTSQNASTTAERPAPASTTAPDVVEPEPFELGAPARLLPPADRWVVVGHETYTDPPSTRSTSDTYAYDRDGALFILTTSLPGGPDDQPGAPEPDVFANRVSAYWTVDGRRFGLTGFDVTVESFMEAARSLVETEDLGWMIDDAELTLAERGEGSPGGVRTQTVFAPVGEDGDVDLTRSITQMSSRRSPGSMYAELGEASSIGITRVIQVAGGPGFYIDGDGMDYGLRYADDHVTSWQTDQGFPDLEAFLEALAVVEAERWDEAVSTAEQTQRDALVATADDLDVRVTADLPRLLLPAPWELVRVNDATQWSPEDQALHIAQLESGGGVPASRTLWVQSFLALDNRDAVVPDIIITVQERLSGNAYVRVDGRTPFDVIDGFVGEVSNAEGPTVAFIERDSIFIEFVSGSLSPDDLIAFAETLDLRSEDGRDGFDYDGKRFTPRADSQTPYFERPSIGSWSASWARDGSEVHVSVAAAPPGAAQALFDGELAWALRSDGDLIVVPGEPFVQHNSGGSIVQWARPDLDAVFIAFGTGDAPLDAARNLEPVTEAAWVAATAPYLQPFELGPGN